MLTNHFVKCAVSELQDIIEAPENELAIWVQQNAKHFLEIQEFYPEEADCAEDFFVLDVSDRDLLYNIVGLYFVQCPWPLNMYSEEVKMQFETKIKAALSRYDWKLKTEETFALQLTPELRVNVA